jgi:hypothetical protein
MVSAKWKKIGSGVAMAAIGAAVGGAVQFMFLAPQFAGQADFLPFIPNNVLIPFVLGAAFFGGSLFMKGKGMFKDVLAYAGVASVGFGVATYANWITPVVTSPGARARAYTPPRRIVQTRPAAGLAAAGTKII